MIAGWRRLMRGETTIDFVGRSRQWLAISGIVIAASLGGIFGRGLNFSLEFVGGSSLTVPIGNDADITDFNDAMDDVGVEGTAQIVTETTTRERGALVRTEETDEKRLADLEGVLARTAGRVDAEGDPDTDTVSRTTIGASWGQQITNKAVRGLIVFIILVAIYISFRFEPKMAVGALAALMHDLISTAGVYALVGFEVSPATVIAFLTLMGYSLYDTVVLYDRVAENAGVMAASGRATYSETVNRSVNEVLMRSVNTTISAVLPIAGLLFVGVFLFGAVTLKDLALAMFVGSIVSSYSSIFVACPLLAKLKEREPRYRQLRMRLAGEPAAARVDGGTTPVEVAPVRPPARPGAPRGPARTARPRGKKRGRGRRR